MTTAAADYPNALPPRHQLNEFRIDSVLGHGGFGITYLATDTTLRKQVAIKEYLPVEFAVRAEGATVAPRSRKLAEDYRWGLDRFLDEARVLARFRHRNIVPVLRFFEANGTAYMVMEHEAGTPLGPLLAGPGRLPPARVRVIVDGIADGLAQVHAAGFLHRDLKPSNIIVRPDGTPVLIDFGAARQALGRGGATLTSIVTPRYAPIEQYEVEGEQGPWTDIYGLSAVAYHAIAGTPPPEAPSRVRKDPYRPLVEAGIAGFDRAFLESIDWGLAVHAEDRPADIASWRARFGVASAAAADGPGADSAARTRVMSDPIPARARAAQANAAAAEPPAASATPAPAAPRRLGGATRDGGDARLQAVPMASDAPPPRRARIGAVQLAIAAAVMLVAGGGAWALLRGGDKPPTTETGPVVPVKPTGPTAIAEAQPGAAPTAAAPKPAAAPGSETDPGYAMPRLPAKPEAGATPGRIEPKGEPVPMKPGGADPGAAGKPGAPGSIDEILGRAPGPVAGAPTASGKSSGASTATNAAARDKLVETTRQSATRAQAEAERAELARTRALERAGDARIRAAEAGKPDLPGAVSATFEGGGGFVGIMADGKRAGLGVAELPTGERQAGDWKDDALDGLGTLRTTDGRGYEGDWRAGVPEGAGVFALAPGERHAGEVKGGKPEGPGVRVVGAGAGATTRAGVWRDGELEGPGVETLPSGQRYEGGFRAGKRHGAGIVTERDGARFHGTFVDGLPDGYGVAVAADGKTTSGTWRAGERVRAEE